MVKVVFETGWAEHSSSSARLQARWGGIHGPYLYTLKQYIKRAEWNKGINEQWITTEYDLPDQSEVYIDGNGRWAKEPYWVRRHYRIDSTADVREETLDVGCHRCLLKGRLVLLKDYVADRRKANEINIEEGF